MREAGYRMYESSMSVSEELFRNELCQRTCSSLDRASQATIILFWSLSDGITGANRTLGRCKRAHGWLWAESYSSLGMMVNVNVWR